MAQKIKIENGTCVNCFVPSCSNKKIIDGCPIHFFQIPQGNEGLRWKVAVNSNRSQHETNIGILRRKISPSFMHCCELHFNMETDTIVAIYESGSVKCNIKPGIIPSVKPTRSKRLWEILGNDNVDKSQEMDCDNTDNCLIQPMRNKCDTDAVTHTGDSISIVDMSTLICKKFDDTTSFPQFEVNDLDNQMEVKYTPLMPLTVELMKRKPMYYMGLEPNLFFRLLQIVKNTTLDVTDSFVEMKIMLALRKHRLNEDFEALGDLFDVDKTTAQQYCAESKNLVSNLYQSLTTSVCEESNDVKNPLWTQDCHVSVQEDEKNSSASPEPKIKYKGYSVRDSDVDSDDFKDISSSSSSSDYSDPGDSDFDYASDEDLGSDENFAKETEMCPVCQKSVGRLDHHMETVHLNPQYLNKTVCGLCFAKFETHKQLLAHQVDMHNGYSCVCDICAKKFQKYSAVKQHILKVHVKLKPFLCHVCGAAFDKKYRLKTHTDNTHLQIRRFECDLCDKKYFEPSTLQAHIRSRHTKERPYKCRFDGCSKSFCRSGNLYTHEQMHKVNFSCEICSKVFTFRQNLQTHCANIHGKKVIDTEKCKIVINQ